MRWIVSLLCIFAGIGGPAHAAAPGRKVTDEDVLRVHRSAILIDTHNDVPERTVEGFDIGKRAADGHTDIPRLRQGGVGAVFFSAWVSPAYVPKREAARRALEMIDTTRHDIVARYPADFRLALSAADIEAAHRQGKIAALIGVEGGHAIEDNLRVLRAFYALGARYLTLTHFNTNNWADSSGDLPDSKVTHHNGLTGFGKAVVREMNRLGMIVDVSHVSDKTFWDVLSVSSAPVFASHSSCRSLSGIPRNMSDEMIAAMAKKGGVIQINAGCEFLSQKAGEVGYKLWAEYGRKADAARAKLGGNPDALKAELKRLTEEQKARVPQASLADVVAHIDHVVKIAGVDAVGIGTDFDGVECTPKGLEDVSKFPNLTRALLEKGYSAAAIHKIYGGNTLRLMRSVEKAAGRKDGSSLPAPSPHAA